MNSQLRLLFLAPFTPRRDGDHGGSRAIAQLIARLAARHEVALIHVARPFDEPIDEILVEKCAFVEGIPLAERGSLGKRIRRRLRLRRALIAGVPTWVAESAAPRFGDRVAELTQEFRPDIVQVEYHVMGQFLPALHESTAPRVLVEHEPGAAAAAERRRHAPYRVLRHLDLRAWRRYERNVARGVDVVVVLTERDRRAVAALAEDISTVVIPLGVELPETPLDPLGTSDELLFFANYLHSPNVDAAVRLARDIFPSVRARHPGATLRLIGPGMPPVVRALAGNGVIVMGKVTSVSPYLRDAAVIVVPLRHGGGMRVKVLESLAYGKAVVASPLAVEGMDVASHQQLVVARTDTEFADAVSDLLSQPERRRELALAARAWAVQSGGWDGAVGAYETLYSSLLSKSVSRDALPSVRSA